MLYDKSKTIQYATTTTVQPTSNDQTKTSKKQGDLLKVQHPFPPLPLVVKTALSEACFPPPPPPV